MYVCLCRAITESMVRDVAREGIVTAEALIERFDLDDEEYCGFCARHIDMYVEIAEDELILVQNVSSNERGTK